MDKDCDPALVLGPGDGHGEDRVQDGDEDDFRHAPDAVAQVGQFQAASGLVHHDAAGDEDDERKEGEQGGEAEEGAVAEPEPRVIGEGDADQQEQNGKKRGESDRAEELISIPEVGGNQSFLSFFHLKPITKLRKKSDISPPYPSFHPRRRRGSGLFATFIWL